MTTPAEQEAERRYPKTARMRFAFESGAAFEREQLRELLEAAREMVDDGKATGDDGITWCMECWSKWDEQHDDDCCTGALKRAVLAAAAALEE